MNSLDFQEMQEPVTRIPGTYFENDMSHANLGLTTLECLHKWKFECKTALSPNRFHAIVKHILHFTSKFNF